MNKVINIQLAGQVFWIDEDAYEILKNYLQKIKEQLSGDSDAQEIIMDIELRLAELMYEVINENKQNIDKANVEKFIKQLGFFENETSSKADVNKPSFESYKILGGVCLELSARTKIPVFILRILFLALIFAAGLGLVIYIILWFSIPLKHKHPETSSIVSSEKTSLKIQKFLFFPFTLLGLLFDKLYSLAERNKTVFAKVLKIVLTIPILIIVIFAFIGIYMMAKHGLLVPAAQFFFGIAASFLILSFLWFWTNKVFLLRKRRLFSKELIQILQFSAIYVIASGIYLIYAFSDSSYKENKYVYKKNFNTLQIIMEDNDTLPEAYQVKYYIYPISQQDSVISLKMEYHSSGKDYDDASENIDAMEYSYSLDDSILTLPTHFNMKEKKLYREQSLTVKIYIPNNLILKTRSNINNYSRFNSNYYLLRYWEDRKRNNYIFYNDYLFTIDRSYKNYLSREERSDLRQIFARTFIRRHAPYYFEDERYDDSFKLYLKSNYQDEFKSIYKIRAMLKKERRMKLDDLNEIHSILIGLEIEYPDLESLIDYLNGLIKVKSMSLKPQVKS